MTIGEIRHGRNALNLLGGDAVLDLLNDAFGSDAVGKFGDDDALALRRDVLDTSGCPGAEGATATFIGLTNAVKSHDLPA